MSTTKTPSSPRVAALVGPYMCGKTALLESILSMAGALTRKGNAKDGYAAGDGSPEAKARGMSTELTVAECEYLGDKWAFIDCPGSVELIQESYNALMVVDAAIVVCEPGEDKAMTIAPLMKFLDDHQIPHIIFINKMDSQSVGVKATFEALQEVSSRPLLLREIPIRDSDGVTGHVDLVSERAFEWREGKASSLIAVPDGLQPREQAARMEMLEALADFDDKLLEELLEDIIPTSDEVYRNLTRDFQEDRIVPVFFGSAEHGNGVQRLMKALRHETPEPSRTAARLGIDGVGVSALVFKSLHAGHAGKLSLARIFGADLKDGGNLKGERVGGLYKVFGQKHDKISSAVVGRIVALGRIEDVSTGDLLKESAAAAMTGWPPALHPLYAMSIHAEKRADEVKLTAALAKVIEEDPGISIEHSRDTGELLLWGQGEMHLLIALDRLRNRFNMAVTASRPQVPYKETIRKSISHHARHKKQSGGHGQFGDVHLDIRPLPRGSGFSFDDSITGGAVPKQYIAPVEHGIKDYLSSGPLGFPVVDVAVTLTDGQFHAVDSSDMAFRAAAQQGMREAMPNCNPVLLEPICQVEISVPNVFNSKIQRLVSSRRGQIIGFDGKPGWKGWDEVTVQLPQSEMFDLVIELRSMTMGVGTFNWRFDHLQEFSGREADKVISERAG